MKSYSSLCRWESQRNVFFHRKKKNKKTKGDCCGAKLQERFNLSSLVSLCGNLSSKAATTNLCISLPVWLMRPFSTYSQRSTVWANWHAPFPLGCHSDVTYFCCNNHCGTFELKFADAGRTASLQQQISCWTSGAAHNALCYLPMAKTLISSAFVISRDTFRQRRHKHFPFLHVAAFADVCFRSGCRPHTDGGKSLY